MKHIPLKHIQSYPIWAIAALTIAASTGLAAFGFIAHASQTQPQPPAPPTQVKTTGDAPAYANLISANNSFGLQLLTALEKQDADKNVFISPTSAALALEMAYNGADGDTKAAMERALTLSGMSSEQLNKANAALLADLHHVEPAVKLKIANSIWVNSNGTTPVKPEFKRLVQQYYNAEVGDLAGAPMTVNAWVSKQTEGKITSILQQSDLSNNPNTNVAVLVNAVYFKGQWAKPFDKSATQSAVFTTLSGHKRDVQMMHQKGEYAYVQGDGFQAVSLPYGTGRMHAYLFLPAPNVKFADFLALLTPENWKQWTGNLHLMPGNIGVPRFRSEYEADLQAPLSTLGMGVAFKAGQADFAPMAGKPGDVWIAKAKQKTFLEVNEEGAEAAAATSIVMRTRAMRVPKPPFDMVLNRPFFCAIEDSKTGALLFVGAVVDPTV